MSDLQILWHSIMQGLIAHLTTVGVGSGVLIVAVIHNWPREVPNSIQAWWTWIGNSLQTAIPIRQPQNPTTAVVATPTAKVVVKES